MSAWIMKNRQAILTTLGLIVTLAVAGFGAWQSWGHITHVGRTVGEPTAPFTAVSIDGMMFVGGVMGAVDRYRGFKTRWWAIIALWLGSAMSISANVASALERGWLAAVWAVVPAVSLLVCVEIMFHPSRRLLALVKTVREAVESLVEATGEPSPTATLVSGPVAPVSLSEGSEVDSAERPLALAEGFRPALTMLPTGFTMRPLTPRSKRAQVAEAEPEPTERRTRKDNPTQARGEGARPTRRKLTAVSS